MNRTPVGLASRILSRVGITQSLVGKITPKKDIGGSPEEPSHPWDGSEAEAKDASEEQIQESIAAPAPPLDNIGYEYAKKKRTKKRPVTRNMVLPWIGDEDVELPPSRSETSTAMPPQEQAEVPRPSMYARVMASFQRWWSKPSGGFLFNDSSPEKDAIESGLKPVADTKKVCIIGVHGWFPIKILQRVVGEPIGTSAYFANKMQSSANLYFQSRGLDIPEEHLTVIPLEGEGKIFDRVDMLYDQLMAAGKEKVMEADLVVFSAHSQGSPVSAILMQRLFKEKIVNPLVQRTGILAMAGISHGPFPHLKSSVIIKYVETERAKELFDFNDPTSTVSVAYREAMNDILTAGCRYVAIGSWYDQVVPLYSATVQGINHPNLYRALYIDAQDYQPDFLSHLLVFALKLRNRGLDDYGLVLHLSDFLAGSIYGFGTQGHSAVYEESQTYTLGLNWILSPPSANEWKGVVKMGTLQAPAKVNPYYLPWIMARLSLDPAIKENTELAEELEHLRVLFLGWTPSDSSLKDLKYRLDPLKAKL
ncbi:hypothetical protein HDV03_004140 [Kappamyces sp. JEL0829]|nr:hypothetical protein HDV03_004140 [Kappamyces sp. JEL0829]